MQQSDDNMATEIETEEDPAEVALNLVAIEDIPVVN